MSSAQRLNAERALIAYNAMQKCFYAGDGSSLYNERPRTKGSRSDRRGWRLLLHPERQVESYAHLWPFTQALAATLDLARIDDSLRPALDSQGAIVDRLAGLERYWDSRTGLPAYASGALAPMGTGGDKYYDDNAWVGLALVAHHRVASQASSRERAEQLFSFALRGWDADEHHPYPGGVFWVQQGRGAGLTDQSRNAVSNAPNAELGFQLSELSGNVAFLEQDGGVGARGMYDWVNGALDASRDTREPGTGLFYDRVQLSGGVKSELWSYNQGTMIGANVLLQRLSRAADSRYLRRAEAIARKALSYYQGQYFNQPEQFNAIFFRNLLLLYGASHEEALKQDIRRAISDYAEEAWQTRRDSDDLFPAGEPKLVKHAAMVQIFAMLAWPRDAYEHL